MSVSPGNQSELSKEEQEAVEQQLEILLTNPALNQSKRYQELLKYIVTEGIRGNTESLKERTLGVEVFGRVPDYDTIKDPIVRVSVAGLRKRLKAYYSDVQNQEQVRIVIPVGSYVPRFIRQEHGLSLPGEASGVPVPEVHDTTGDRPDLSVYHPKIDTGWAPSHRINVLTSAVKRSHSFRRAAYALICAAVVIIFILLGQRIRFHRSAQSAISMFWNPLIKQDQLPICAMGESNTMSAEDSDVAKRIQTPTTESNSELIRYDDANPLLRIAEHLQAGGVRCRLSISSTLSLSDLRQGPTILIGAFNNAWTLRLTEQLRFHFGNDVKSNALWIEDKATGTRWPRNTTDRDTTDYAIIARYRDDLTNEPTLVVAGLGSGGTVAAGEFATDPVYIESLSNGIAPQTLTDNFEIIIETEIIGGKPGAPHVVSSYFWK